ncbi:MAG: DUF1365 family protein [Actinomycetes bacterium]
MTATIDQYTATGERQGLAGRSTVNHRSSALYEGSIWHRRLSPKPHSFKSSIVMTLLDLDEIDEVFDDMPLWSHRNAAPVHFRRSDYLDGGDGSLIDALGDVVERELGRRPAGPIRMLTHVRTWGWVFNPITIYWCFDAAGQPDVVVLEVTNTPWKERHWYVIEADSGDGTIREFPKSLHVSPFMDMDLTYRFSFTAPVAEPGSSLAVRLELVRDDSTVFEAELALNRVALTRRSALTALLRHPLQTFRVSATIHLQAVRLWSKRVPYIKHPARKSPPATGIINRTARQILWILLGRAGHGKIVVREDGGDEFTFGTTQKSHPDETLISVNAVVHNPRTYRSVLSGGSAALGHAYLQGWWDVDDLTGFLRLLTREVSRYGAARNGVARTVGRGFDRIRARQLPNKQRDRENIRAHYDLGNDFFSLMLDETMMYSSGYFSNPDTTLTEASVEKLDRMCRRIALGPDDHVIEIGTGWGGFALHAAANYGCRVTTTTISKAQFDFSTARVSEAGLSHLIEVRHDDYRDLTGTYDKLVSIEMIEAVDWRELDTYFASCATLLKPGGMMGLQAIVIPDERYERAKNTEDFIKAFIFPGGCLPSIGSITRSTKKVTDFAISSVDDFGLHYAETLRRWRTNIDNQRRELPALGLDEPFQRMWDFYLAYCEAAFDEREISVVQLTLTRPV